MHDTIPAAGITARGWGWRHAGRRRWALRDIDLDIAPGERVLLLGASGSGKSTLLHALAGVLGEGDDGESAGELRLTGGIPGLVLQDPDSQVILERVGDDVAFGCENLGVPTEQIWPRVGESLAAVGLDLPLSHPTRRLSGGQQQRLALAGVLAMRPGLLLLDEPTANLDPEGVAEVRAAVARVLDRTGATLVVVEHRVSVWADLVDRVIVVGEQGLIADGTPAEVFRDHGDELRAAGVWLPDAATPAPRRAHTAGPTLLEAGDLAIGRERGIALRSGIDLRVTAGECLAVTGPNGVGKSTLGLTLAGLIEPIAGQVLATPALAQGAAPEPHRWRSRQLLTRIGTVFQNPEHQFVARTVREELAVGPRAAGIAPGEVDRRTDELLSRLRLDALAEANPFTLSGGEQRRLSVATALATRPELLVLDEPTFGQDARTWGELVALCASLLDDGSAIVAVTHDAEFVHALADAEYRMSGVSADVCDPR